MPWNPRSIALSCALSSPTSRPRHDWSGGDLPNLPLWPLQSAINIPVIKIQVSLFLALSLSISLTLPPSLPPYLPPSSSAALSASISVFVRIRCMADRGLGRGHRLPSVEMQEDTHS
jgi:hypothetical protein